MGSSTNDRASYVPKSFQSGKNEAIIVRSAQIEDAASICKLGSFVFSTSFGYSLSAKDLQDYLDKDYTVSAMETQLSDTNVHFLIALKDGKVVGFVQLTIGAIESCVAKEPNPVELQRLYLDPDQHGSGLAKFLVQEIIDLAQHLGFQTMFLGVWEENFKAQNFYKKMGFTRVGEHDFVMGDCVQTDWILSKPL